MTTFDLLVIASFALILLPCLAAIALLNLRRGNTKAAPLFPRTASATAA